MKEAIFKLEDGRSLAYAVYGKKEHRAMLYFHGTPSSRLEPLILQYYGYDLEALLDEAKLQLIAIDRPGMGCSAFNPKGDYISFAADVMQLCRHLNLPPLPVLCWSGGGMYALAMAHQCPAQITSVHIVTGFTRVFSRDVIKQMGMNRWYFLLARYTPILLRTAMNIMGTGKIRRTVPRAVTGLPREDYVLMNTPVLLSSLAQHTFKEAVRFGARGAVYEARGYYRDPGFTLEDIHQEIHYWWGTKDMTVNRLHAEEIERRAPNVVMHYVNGEGHLSIYIHHFKPVISQI